MCVWDDVVLFFFFFQAEDGIRDYKVTGVQTCALPIFVIANAGVSWGVDTSMREDIDTMQQVLAVNTMGVAASFLPFIAPMVKRGSGQLFVIAIVAGLRGLPGQGAYGTVRALVIAYSESYSG